jgi:Porin PorA
MRRQVGITLTGLGAFLLVLALMGRFVVPGQVIKFPINEYTVSRLVGHNMTYLSDTTGKEVTGATVRAVSTTQGDVSAGTSSTAVWNNVTGVFDITTSANPGAPVSYSTERLAFDRRTGVLENCCGAELGTKHYNFSGQGYVWPIGTQKQTYQIYDTTLHKTEPANYTGSTTVDGLAVYIFVEHVTNLQIGSVNLPGSLVGQSAATVTLPEYLTETNTYYVDPGTGSPVKVSQQQSQTLQNPDGSTALVLYSGTLVSTPPTVQAAVNTASSSDTEISWVQDIGPLIALLLGVFLLVFGLLLLLGDGRTAYEYEEYDDAGSEPATA